MQGEKLMFDWNNNGEYDMQDSMIDYHIYKSVTNNQKNRGLSSSSSDTMTTIGAVLLVFGILLLIGMIL